MNTCPFCNLKDTDRIVYKDYLITVFLSRDAVSKGQSIIIPNRHVQYISELSLEEIKSIFKFSGVVSSILKKKLDYDGVNLVINDGKSAGQTIDHLHLHIIPRSLGDIPNPKYWLNDLLFQKLYNPSEQEYREISSTLKKSIKDNFSLFLCESDRKIDSSVIIGKDVESGKSLRIYSKSKIGNRCYIGDNVIIGHPTTNNLRKGNEKSTIIGDGGIVRSGSVVYSGVKIGKNLDCAHNVLIRENTNIGNNVYILPGTQIHSNVSIGNDVRLSGFISNRSIIEDNTSVLGSLLHSYKQGKRGMIEEAPIVKKGAVVGMGAIIIGGITIGEDSVIGAGAVVTKDVPAKKIFVGIPAREIV